MRRVLVLLTLAAVAAFFTPIVGAQTLPPLPGHMQAILDCEDPDFPPQSPSGQCATLISHVGDGVGNDSRWNCTQPLDSYGPRPIIVNHIEPNNPNNPPGAIALGNTPGSYPVTGCTVPSQRVPGSEPLVRCEYDQKADLFLQVNGNRGNLGSNNDLVKTFGASCIEIGDPEHPGGKWMGGMVSNGAHMDGLNANYLRGLHAYGLEIGDWEKLGGPEDDSASGAHGAGGLWYMSQLRDIPEHLYDTVCYGCKLVGSGAGPDLHPGQPDGGGGAGFSLYGSDSSGMVDSCVAHRRPFFQRSDAVNPINVNNFFYDRDEPGGVDPQDCPLVDDDPPPPPPLAQCEDGLDNDADGLVDMADPGCVAASDDDEFNEPEPDPDPDPEPCDEACVADLRAQVLSLTTQLDACMGKLRNISAFFHHRPKDIFRAYKMHAKVHETSPCSDRWHG